ncbi:MAG TPA: hypothetical protein VGS97_07975 [Actinocrinis sp.]|uniref:hypothetical protein n=1 Tax=Actinocrinis sp. TaxID=1920516 RepID=UPI002DDCA708|nr:hypothetical protein [Actinocrinis sp.]HEV2344015.1 hypothetical protein [Actinocrinis sp.]
MSDRDAVHRRETPMIAKCKVVIDAISTTVLNDKITFLHAGKGVAIPTVGTKLRHIITAPQFDAVYQQFPSDMFAVARRNGHRVRTAMGRADRATCDGSQLQQWIGDCLASRGGLTGKWTQPRWVWARGHGLLISEWWRWGADR